ncbi:MAG: hypothetical protein KAS78_01570 [Candidatus Pacebacteria bacterium]|nr:hypothetical protein [Candidatus Paceibacterota bacterium]
MVISHTCKNLLIRCMDFRLNSEVERWTKDSGLFEGGFDVVSVAGACKNLVDGDEKIKDNFLSNIAVSIELHEVCKIVILHHSDCGAYAQSYNFSSPEEEKIKQVEDMKKAKEIILEKYPNVEIILVFGQMKDSNGKEVELEMI